MALADWLRDPANKESIRAALDEARRRTWSLMDGVRDEDWDRPVADYLSPPNWDVGHMANFEELWLVQNLAEHHELHAGYNTIYDAFATPRQDRPKLRLLGRSEARAYMDEVRQQSLAVLEQLDLDASRLTRGGFVHWMIVLHEHQHQETLLQSLTMLGPERYTPPRARPLPEPQDIVDAWQAHYVTIPRGTFRMGTEQGPGVYDNEAPPHTVELPAFQMARYPATCGQYLQFIEEGGYDDARWWSARGRQWLDDTPHHAPLYWQRIDGAWHRTDLRGTVPIAEVEDEILCHVTYFEAEAFAAWAGARLPTEAEWERACRGRIGARNPWGDTPATTDLANVDQLGLGPSRVGAYPDGGSPDGVEHMIGDVWEWTSSDWQAYPGFEAFPYEEYSDVFWGGDYKVLRGGAWSARAGCATGTFRNWDHPYRRQIFSGIRLARDA